MSRSPQKNFFVAFPSPSWYPKRVVPLLLLAFFLGHPKAPKAPKPPFSPTAVGCKVNLISRDPQKVSVRALREGESEGWQLTLWATNSSEGPQAKWEFPNSKTESFELPPLSPTLKEALEKCEKWVKPFSHKKLPQN